MKAVRKTRLKAQFRDGTLCEKIYVNRPPLMRMVWELLRREDLYYLYVEAEEVFGRVIVPREKRNIKKRRSAG